MEKSSNLEQASLGKRVAKAAKITALYTLVTLGGMKLGGEIGDRVVYGHFLKDESSVPYSFQMAADLALREWGKDVYSVLGGMLIGGACAASGLRSFRKNYSKREEK